MKRIPSNIRAYRNTRNTWVKKIATGDSTNTPLSVCKDWEQALTIEPGRQRRLVHLEIRKDDQPVAAQSTR